MLPDGTGPKTVDHRGATQEGQVRLGAGPHQIGGEVAKRCFLGIRRAGEVRRGVAHDRQRRGVPDGRCSQRKRARIGRQVCRGQEATGHLQPSLVMDGQPAHVGALRPGLDDPGAADGHGRGYQLMVVPAHNQIDAGHVAGQLHVGVITTVAQDDHHIGVRTQARDEVTQCRRCRVEREAGGQACSLIERQIGQGDTDHGHPQALPP